MQQCCAARSRHLWTHTSSMDVIELLIHRSFRHTVYADDNRGFWKLHCTCSSPFSQKISLKVEFWHNIHHGNIFQMRNVILKPNLPLLTPTLLIMESHLTIWLPQSKLWICLFGIHNHSSTLSAVSSSHLRTQCEVRYFSLFTLIFIVYKSQIFLSVLNLSWIMVIYMHCQNCN